MRFPSLGKLILPGGHRSLAGLSLVLAGLTIGGKALAMVREMLIAGRFGATDATDAFYLAFTLTVGLPMGLLFAIPQSLLPRYQALSAQDGRAAADLYGAALLLVVLGLGGLAVGSFLGAGPLVGLLAPRFSPDTAALAVRWTRTMLPLLPLLGAASVIVALAQARGHFILVQGGVALLHVGAVLGLLLASPTQGVGGAATGYLLGGVAMAVTLASYPARERLWPRGSVEALGRAARVLGSVVLIVGIGNGGGYAAELVERAFWVRLPSGELSCLGYAQRLASLPHFVLSGSLLMMLLPALSARGGDEASALARRALRVFLLVIVLPGAVLATLGDPVVEVVYGGGSLSPDAVALTARLLALLLPTLTLAVFRVTLDTLCFSQGRVAIPLAFGAVRVLLMVGALSVAGPRWGSTGLVLAVALVDLLLLPVQLLGAQRLLGLRFPGLAAFCARLSLAGATAALVALGTYRAAGGALEEGSRVLLGLGVAGCGVLGLAAGLAVAVGLGDLRFGAPDR